MEHLNYDDHDGNNLQGDEMEAEQYDPTLEYERRREEALSDFNSISEKVYKIVNESDELMNKKDRLGLVDLERPIENMIWITTETGRKYQIVILPLENIF